MNIEHLRYLIEVDRCGSITQAAKALFISPQGLNKAISALEAKAGVRLVERARRGTTLTAEGQRFLSFAKETVHAYDEILASFVQPVPFALPANTQLSIGATSYALHTVLSDSLGSENLSFMRIEELSPSVILERLSTRGNTHLFVTDLFENSSLASKALEGNAFEPILRTDFGIISHVDYPLDTQTITAEELLDIPFVCFKDESIDWILQRTFGDTQPRSLLLRTSNSDQLIKRVLTKRVVCLLDSFAYHRLERLNAPSSHELRFTPVAGMPCVTTGFLYNRETPLEDYEFEFMQAFKARFEQQFANYLAKHP